MMKKTILSLAVLASLNVYAEQALFNVTASHAPLIVNEFAKSQSILSSTQFTLNAATERLTIPLDGMEIEFTKQQAQQSVSGNLIWQGMNAQGEHATLVQSNAGITGTVQFENRLFKIQPSENNTHLITEIDQANTPQEHPQGFNENTPSHFETLNFNQILDNSELAATAAVADIKLLVVYTATAQSKVADINSLIDLAITETNAGYGNSGINAKVSLAHKAKVNYTEAPNSSTDLTRLAAKNDGYMDEVHSLRDQYAADVVVLVHDTNGYCGQADAIGANADSAFVIVDYDCATGYYSFGHEIGHLQGARHNPENDPTTTPYAYGHGYQDPQSRWRSVMAYNCNSGCTRINYWSNPNKTYNGDVMGTTAQNDNARVLNLTSPVMANFRTGVILPPEEVVLENNQALTVAGAKDSQTFYSFSVPSGASNISIVTSGGTGDADLYVKLGSKAAINNWDCRPYESGNAESCPLTQSGDYSVMLSGYSTYSNVRLVGSYQLGGVTLPIVMNESNISIAKDTWQYYSVEAPANATNVSVTISGGTGDADLYVRKDAKPTLTSYTCRPWRNGNSEKCSETNSVVTTWHVGVYGYAAVTGLNLEINVQ